MSKDNLTWNKKIPGAGVFKFNKNLVLTKNGMSRSKWQLPVFFKNIKITYHSKKSWKQNYFKSAEIGQEFIFEENNNVEKWAKKLIKNSTKNN